MGEILTGITKYKDLTQMVANIFTVAAVAVALGVGYSQLNNFKATRHAQVVQDLFKFWSDKETYEAYAFTSQELTKFETWDSFCKEVPPGSEPWRKWIRTMNFFNVVGMLVKEGALERETAFRFLKDLLMLWEKMAPIAVGYRKAYKSEEFAVEFEWLYNEYRTWKRLREVR